MGLLATSFVKILPEKFGVCLKGDADPRYFTTQADATHFSGCMGKIVSCNGLYEGMMDRCHQCTWHLFESGETGVDDRTLVGPLYAWSVVGIRVGCPR